MDIRRLALTLACAVLAAGPRQLSPDLVAPAKADCDTMMVELDHVRDARGTTFLGTLRYLSIQSWGATYTFEVERIYAGQIPSEYTVRSSGCHSIPALEVDRRY